MFKLLEKKPFMRWKFVQRMVHKHRMTNKTGSNRFRTFSRESSNDTERFIDIHSVEESEVAAADTSSSATKSAFYSRRKIDEANAEIGITPDGVLDPKHRSEPALDMTEITDSTSDDIEVLASSEELSEVTENLSKTNSKPEYNPISFQRSSKLRNSFKEFKRRSAHQLGNVRESVRRRTHSRKYGSLSEQSKAIVDEEIVDYDHSPGSKRRPQGGCHR
ncbi:uncharacterized protein [Watersipora subatra]|uniref:uncharacterized protein isoform X2 n=1 Tax=Watersipora subatra TaxID=2589382 RepID=UPI00355B993E